MKVIYLQQSPSVNGRDSLRGRKLLDKSRDESDECLLGHAVVENEFYAAWKEQESRRDLISYDMLRDVSPDLLYIEGGMLASVFPQAAVARSPQPVVARSPQPAAPHTAREESCQHTISAHQTGAGCR